MIKKLIKKITDLCCDTQCTRPPPAPLPAPGYPYRVPGIRTQVEDLAPADPPAKVHNSAPGALCQYGTDVPCSIVAADRL